MEPTQEPTLQHSAASEDRYTGDPKTWPSCPGSILSRQLCKLALIPDLISWAIVAKLVPWHDTGLFDTWVLSTMTIRAACFFCIVGFLWAVPDLFHAGRRYYAVMAMAFCVAIGVMLKLGFTVIMYSRPHSY